MKKLLLILLCLCVCTCALDAKPRDNAVDTRNSLKTSDGFWIYVVDSNVGSTASLISTTGTFNQVTAASTIEIKSNAGDTTQTVTIRGVDNRGKARSEDVTLTGTVWTTTSATFTYFDQAWLDGWTSGAIDIRKNVGDKAIMSIASGTMSSSIAQRFSAEKNMVVQEWGASLSGSTTPCNIYVELRWYPAAANSLTPGTGYMVLDKLTATSRVANIRHLGRGYEDGIKCPQNGWLAVYGNTDSLGGQEVTVRLKGYQSQR